MKKIVLAMSLVAAVTAVAQTTPAPAAAAPAAPAQSAAPGAPAQKKIDGPRDFCPAPGRQRHNSLILRQNVPPNVQEKI